jgi:ABC-type transporter Mla subunit MlaD
MRRTWLIAGAALVIAAAAIVVAVVLVRNSDSESSPSTTTEWAGQVCTSLSKWRTSIESLANVSGIPTQDDVRKKLTDAQVATEQLITDLRKIGPPETTAGTQLKQHLDQQGDRLQQSYEKVKARAQDAANNATGAADFLRRLAAVLPDFQKLLNEVSTTIDTLESSNVAGDSADEVKEGFDKAESCKKLRSEQD